MRDLATRHPRARRDHANDWPFVHVEVVRYGDLDAMRHVGNVSYLRYVETARVAYVGSILPGYRPDQPHLSGLIVAACHIDYRSPAFLDEEVRVLVRPGDVSRSSFKAMFEMRAGAEGRLVAEGFSVLVSYDYDAQHAVPIAPSLREALVAQS